MFKSLSTCVERFLFSQSQLRVHTFYFLFNCFVRMGVLRWRRSGKFFLFEVYNFCFLIKFPSCLFAFFDWCLICSRTWIGSNLFIFKNLPFFHRKNMGGLFSKQHFVKLIGDSLIIFVLSRPWILLFWFKHGASLNYFLKDFVFFFMKYFFHVMN